LDHRLSEVNRLVDDECATFRNSAALRLLSDTHLEPEVES